MVENVPQLAILGGAPAFEQILHVGRPNIGDVSSFLAKAADMLERRWLTNNGPFVQELEQRLASVLGVRNVVAMCNGTIAMEIAIRAAGLTGEVIVPSFTFIATAHALQWQEITPVFCDVDPRTHNIDPAQVRRLITPRTTGILGVHVWGRACDTDALEEIAAEHGLTLLFDAAHAFGSESRGRRVGGFGRAEIFSFHGTKFYNTFEGGAVATDDDEFAHVVRLMRNFGFEGIDTVTHVGTNGKMPEICAAMGLVGLDSLDSFIAANRRNFELYRSALSDVRGLRLLDPTMAGSNNYQYVVLEIDGAEAGLTRDDLVQVLWAENVHARRYFFPGCHRMEPYRSYFPNAGMLLPVTEGLTERVMVLPTGTAVNPEEIAVVCRIIKSALSQAVPVREQISSRGVA